MVDNFSKPHSGSTNPAPAGRTDHFGFGLAITGALLFSTKGVFIKLAYSGGVSPDTLLALRMIVAVPVYVVIGLYILASSPLLRQKLKPRVVVSAALTGITGYYIASLLDFTGLLYVSAQYERIVLFIYPFFTFALGVMFFGDKMNWRILPALAVSWSGLLVMFGWSLSTNPDGLLLGTALILASGLTFALYQHLARKSMAHLGPILFTCIAMTAAGSLAIAQVTVQSGLTRFISLSPEIWAYGLALGLLGTILPSFLLNAAIQRIGPRATSATGAFGPLMTIMLAVSILGEPFTIFHGVGSALVITGILLFARAERQFKIHAQKFT